MMKISAQLDRTGVQKLLVNVPKQLRFRFLDAFDHIGRSFYKTFNEQNLGGRPYIKAGPRPSIRSRFKYNVMNGLTQKEFGVNIFFSRSPVARRQEFGETITAGSAGARIAVPLSARGSYLFNEFGRVRRQFSLTNRLAKQINAGDLGLKTYIRPIKAKDGQWYLAVIKPKAKNPDERVKPIFVLKDSVTIPPRMRFFATYEEMTPKFQGYLKEALDKGVDEA